MERCPLFVSFQIDICRLLQSREIAFVSRELDADNRRVRAVREAFGVAYATDGPSAA